MIRKPFLAVAVAAAAALVISACGSTASSSDGSKTPAPSESTSAPAESSAESSAESPAESSSAAPSESSESTAESSGDAASGAPTCDATPIGAFVRCENFYDDYWPTIEKNMQALYEEAKATDGGRLVVWDWYEQAPEVVALFNKSFPDIKLESQGLNYNLSSAIISAKATGERNTDVVSGSIVTMAEMYDQGFWADIDWTTLGIPAEFLKVGGKNLLPDSINAAVLHYNTTKVDSVPGTLDGLDDPKYKGKVGVQNYSADVFAGYGMKFGKDKMVNLIKSLKANGVLQVVDDVSGPLSSGDIPIDINQAEYSDNPILKASPFDGSDVFGQFSDVNTDAGNPAAGKLWILWNSYNPEWINERMTNPEYSSTQTPFIGLPSSVFAKAVGLAKTNADVVFAALDSGNSTTETMEKRDEWTDMINASDAALNG